MEMRNPARAETLANFTPVLFFNAWREQDESLELADAADETAAESIRQDFSIKSLCSLVERMWLHPTEAEMHRSTYEDLMTKALVRCRSGAAKDGLLDALRRVHGKDYVKALASLRAVAA